MTKKKKQIIIPFMILGSIVITVILVFGVVFAGGLPWSIIYVGGMLSEDPPQPEITYGEFPFELVYEVDGKVKTVNDIIIIEYEGVAYDGREKYLTWNSHLKNAKKTDYKTDSYKGIFNGVLIFEDDKIAIYCHWGSEAYYMGKNGVTEPEASLFGIEKEGNLLTYGIDEIIKEHNIKVLDYKFSKPIENTFK